MKRRIGKFKIGNRFLNDPNAHRLFSGLSFVPIRVRPSSFDNIEYTGYSPMFEQVGAGYKVPEYKLTFNGSGALQVRKL